MAGGVVSTTDRVATLRAVDGALQLSAPFLATDPVRLPGQLTGRLAGIAKPGVVDFLDEARRHAPRPWLCPLTPALAPAGGPLERVLLGHAGSVTALAVTPDGTRIVSGGDREDRIVRVWDLARGRLERTLEGHTDWVNAVAVTPDGARVVAGVFDRTVRIWDLASGRLERTLEGYGDSVDAVAITPDGAWIVSGVRDATVWIWDIATGRLEGKFGGHTDAVYAVAITQDGSRVVSGSWDGTVRVWDLASGRQIASWAADPDISVHACCTFPTDPSLFAYGDSAGGVNVLQLLDAPA